GKPTTLDVLKISAQSIDASHWEWQREQELRRSRNPQSSSKPSGSDAKLTSTPTNDSSTAQSGDSKKKKKKGGGGNGGNSGRSPAQTTSTPPSEKPYASVLGADGKLLPAEKARRISENLCLLCGGKGHRSSDCPKKKSAAGRAANATPAPAPA
ncbi:hypothetical protein DFH06DRAFT_908870, partial [Mycena polygramma]